MYTAKEIAKAHGMLSEGEVDLIHLCASKLPENAVIINIGAGAGTSTLAFLESHPTAVVFEIDIVKRGKAREHTKHYADRVIRIIGDSKDVGRAWMFPVDAVFVDGNHSLEGVRGDTEAWEGKIKKGGIILFHDYAHANLPHLTEYVDQWAAADGAVKIGESRYLIGFFYER